MNKVDLLPEKKRESLRDTDSVMHVSAAKGIGLDKLLALIDAKITEDPVQRVRLRVPQSEGKALAMLDAKASSSRVNTAMAMWTWKLRPQNRCCGR